MVARIFVGAMFDPVKKKATNSPPIADIPLMIPVIAPAIPTLRVDGFGVSCSFIKVRMQIVTKYKAIRICSSAGSITARIDTPMMLAMSVPMERGSSSLYSTSF